MFEPIRIEDTRPIAFLKKAILVIIALQVVILAISGYRAYFQVRSLELVATERIVHSGSTLHTNVVSYARTPVYVTIEMIQRGQSETLAKQTVLPNEWSLYDPRTQSGELTVVLTPAQLAKFQPGSVLVRATAIGCPQWTRLPPPVVCEVTIEIERERVNPQ